MVFRFKRLDVMDAKLEKRLLNEWFSGKRRTLAEKAIERLENKNPFAFVKEKTTRCKEIEEKDFFGDIEKMMKFLSKLRSEGYTRLIQKWYGYEENGFIAEKDDNEDEEEILARFYHIVDDEVKKLYEEIDEKEKKKAEIEKLRKKIKELERGFKD